jgi:hypothetical protein
LGDAPSVVRGAGARVVAFFGQYAKAKIAIVKKKNPKKINSSMSASSLVL